VVAKGPAPDFGPTIDRGTGVTTGPLRVVLYVREGCHLCDEFLVELSLDLGSANGQVEIVDVDGEPDVAARYGQRVPVLEIAGEVACEGRYDAPRVRRALQV
jgi:hypothetical protein